MAIAYPIDEDTGRLRPFTEDEIEAMEIRTRGVADGSHPTHSRRAGANTIRAQYRVKFDEFDNFLVYMLGAVIVYFDEELEVDLLSRLPPQTYPGRPRFVCMQLEDARGAGAAGQDGEESGVPEYPDMDCTMVFEQVMMECDVTDDEATFEYERYCQRLPTKWDASYLSMPGGILKYTRRPTDPTPTASPHGKPIQHNVGYTQPTGIISRKWWRIPQSAWTEDSKLYRRFFGDPDAATPDLDSRPYVGTINHAPFLGYPAGTLLLLPPEEEIVPDPFGLGDEVNLTLRWLFDPQGHNYFRFWNPANPSENGVYFVSKDAVWESSDVLTDNRALFDARDHKQLLMVGDPPA